jgi:hypothetical protein
LVSWENVDPATRTKKRKKEIAMRCAMSRSKIHPDFDRDGLLI